MAKDLAALSAVERWVVEGSAADNLARVPDPLLAAFRSNWALWGRPAQIAPPGDWTTWLLMAGRGFGKTRAGAEWVRGQAEGRPGLRIALVGATAAEARQVMVEGDSGLLGITPAAYRPTYEPSLRRLTWPNGAEARLYSAAEPESLRGPQHHVAWTDEIAKWPAGQAAWSNLRLGLRLDDSPRIVATTTPQPVPLVRRLIAEAGTVTTRGRSDENAAHLGTGYLGGMRRSYGGTRLGRQELDGELLEDFEGALWSRALIEACRVAAMPCAARRVVIGVDPPASAGGDACGIVAVALGADGCGYVIADATVSGLSPDGWARVVARTAAEVRADRIVAEANNGGEMVRSLLVAADAALPVTLVHASHGKATRAEPVSALYARRRMFHAGAFPELEDQLAGMMAVGTYVGPGRSPDRADALVWAAWALLLGPQAPRPGLRVL